MISGAAGRCPAWPISTLGRRRWPSESARRCGRTTTSLARTAATATAWPRARRRTACLPSYWARRRGTAGGRAGRCTSPTRRPGTWAPTPSSPAARGRRARQGGGPPFPPCHTYRFHGHHVGDVDRSYYRSKEEEQQWRSGRDPLRILADWLRAQGMAQPGDFERIERSVRALVEAAVQFALSAPYPEASEVHQDVYA